MNASPQSDSGHARLVDDALALLGGELRDAEGAVLTPDARHITMVAADAAGRVAAAAALAGGRTVAVAVPLAEGSDAAQLLARAGARSASARAIDLLRTAGAVRTRTVAVAAARGALFAVYECGGASQAYVEGHVLMALSYPSLHERVGRRLLEALSGVPMCVDLLLVIGEPA